MGSSNTSDRPTCVSAHKYSTVLSTQVPYCGNETTASVSSNWGIGVTLGVVPQGGGASDRTLATPNKQMEMRTVSCDWARAPYHTVITWSRRRNRREHNSLAHDRVWYAHNALIAGDVSIYINSHFTSGSHFGVPVGTNRYRTTPRHTPLQYSAAAHAVRVPRRGTHYPCHLFVQPWSLITKENSMYK